MTHTLYIPLNYETDGIPGSVTYPLLLQEDLQDIIKYSFEKKFEKEYKELEWHLEPGAKELVKTIETDWYKNKIDTLSLYTENEDFIDWLKEQYYNVALDQYTREEDEYKYEISMAEVYLMSVYPEVFE